MSSATPACASQFTLFRHVEEGAGRSIQARARALCGQCPLAIDCLYDAVVHYDVAGMAAGTLPDERLRIRHLLRVQVSTPNLDVIAGVPEPSRVDAQAIARLRRAYPNDTLAQLASRLGCSQSTLKRHLRTLREPARPVERPTSTAVWDAARSLGVGVSRAA